ncbi:hypothetical protein H5410_015221 [Solanum commersonii]|uniref:Uncharacterized protein n=1 Tax=Solanum commersonii TaxID=4109 RepID=A0A9J5ZSY8_SOLCO|nr:hypothetical protein H5410_015221 [Solanum commersonii]
MILTQVKIIITYTVLHNYLLEYRRSDKIFIVYEHENIAAIDIEQQMTQSNNVDSSSWSYDREIQVLTIDDLETNYFVLVHGAWCWYKTIAPLEHAGFKDLTGSSVHSFDTNSITSLSQYAKPLIAFLENLAHGHKVILVMLANHSSSIPLKFQKLYLLLQQCSLVDNTKSNDLTRQSQIFIYANGNDKPPTAIDLDKSLMKDLLFNHSPAKSVALASVSMKPIPFSPVLEKLSLSDIKYGSIRQFYIETTEDSAIPIALQQYMISQNPPAC